MKASRAKTLPPWLFVVAKAENVLFHWFDHRFDEGDFIVCQVVLLIEFFIRPGLGEVLERDETEFLSRYILSRQQLKHQETDEASF